MYILVKEEWKKKHTVLITIPLQQIKPILIYILNKI